MSVALPLLLILLGAQSQDVRGPVTYSKDGVTLQGKTTPWNRVQSIEETDPDWRAEHDARKIADTAPDHVAAAAWCRIRGLEAEGKKHLERALELQPDCEAARIGLGREAALVEAERTSRIPVQFADWCRARALASEEWSALAAAAVADGYDREMLRRMRERVSLLSTSLVMRAPLAGRWKAAEDRTKHHMAKVWALWAIDFVKVEGEGRSFRNRGRALTDYPGFGEPVYAAADGVVSESIDRFDDRAPGSPGGFEEANAVILMHSDSEGTDYAHLKKGSVRVKVGDRVKKGDLLGQVGNSGATAAPHLHFAMFVEAHARDGSSMSVGRPYRFENVRLVEAFGVRCDVKVKVAQPQEGWVLECPAP